MKSIEELYHLFINSNRSICTDTRKITKGSLFICLKGENFNGNLFAEQAIQLGARYVIADENIFENENIFLVENALETLQKLANYHRKHCKALILAIGGSNGKTTTKELVSAVLSTQYQIQFTKGNLNNHIGLPLTLLEIQNDCEIAIVEMGANHIGDIAELCLIAEPDLGIITNIGKEHLEGFGSIEGVAKAESELFDFLLKNNGFAFVNYDDVWLNNMSKRLLNKKSYSIEHSDTDTNIQSSTIVPNIQLKYKHTLINSHLMGAHNLQNIAATIAIAEHFGISEENISKGIESYKPQNNRSQIIETQKGNTVLLDAYNANPSSVESAIETFKHMNKKKQLIILGDMFELGDYALSEHQIIAKLCANLLNIETVLVGSEFYNTNLSSDHVTIFLNKNEAMTFIKNKKINNQNILIKGSRGMKMEDFMEAF